MYLGVIETQGNQAYVFSSNREKAIRGASELLFRSTTDWVIDAVTGTTADRSFDDRAKILREHGTVGSTTAFVIATSGRAVVIDAEFSRIEAIINHVTARALREAPGLLVAGSIVPLDLDTHRGFDTAFHDARSRLAMNITSLGPRQGRSCNIPFIRVCNETGLAASELDRTKNSWVSYQLHAHTTATSSSRSRLESLVGSNFASSVDNVADGKNWRAVFYADGNAIGRLFGALSDMVVDDSLGPRAANLQHLKAYQEFSLALEQATELSLIDAASSLSDGRVMPILLGGDDVIAQVSANRAVDFAVAYLEFFEQHSQKAVSVLKEYARPGVDVPEYLTSSAGIAIVKAHFPFSAASNLAEELLNSAKTAKEDGRRSTFDFHVSYDSTAADLASIRSMRTSLDGVKLWGGPYAIDDRGTSVSRPNSALKLAIDAIDSVHGRSQIQHMKEAARRSGAEFASAVSNALHIGDRDSQRIGAIETLAKEFDGHLLLHDAMEIADIDRKVREL